MSVDRQAGLPQSLLLLLGSCLPVLGAVLLAPVLPRMQAHFADTPGATVLVPIALTLPEMSSAYSAKRITDFFINWIIDCVIG